MNSSQSHADAEPSAGPGQRVLIAGCGDLGLRVAALHRARGDAVYALRRTAGLVAPYESVVADLAGDAPLTLPGGLDLVYFTAAPGTTSPGTAAPGTTAPGRGGAEAATAAAYQAVYQRGLGRLLAALGRDPPRRFLLVTSTRPYAQSHGEWVDESSPVEAWDFRAAALLAGESLLAGSGIPGTALRLAGLYGGKESALLRRVQAGSHCSKNPPQWTNRVHRDDAARALLHVAHLPAAESCYVVCDDAPAPQWEVLGWLAGRLGAPDPIEASPQSGAPNRRCSNARLRHSGWTPTYPDFRAGYGALSPAL